MRDSGSRRRKPSRNGPFDLTGYGPGPDGRDRGPAREDLEFPASDASPGSPPDTAVDLQRQINELRTDLLDERERSIDRQQQANGVLVLVLGMVIGVGGIWTYARFKAIARDARIGAAAAQGYVLVPQDLDREAVSLPGQALHPQQSARLLGGGRSASHAGQALRSLGKEDATGLLRTFAPAVEDLPDGPALQGPAPVGDTSDPDFQRNEEAVADCTEAIRLHPDDPGLYLERAEARSRLGHLEDAITDYDRAIRLDAEDPAAYLGRCKARSELGRHEEAIEDFECLIELDPDSASGLGDF